MPENTRSVQVTLYGPADDVNPLLLWLLAQLEQAKYDPELTRVEDAEDAPVRAVNLTVRWRKS